MRRSLTVILMLFLFFACQQREEKKSKVLSEGTPEAGGFSSSRLALLDSSMNNWVKNNWVNGSVVLIARKGQIVFHKAYGYNDLEAKTPLDKNGIFRIASQTKAITTVAAMILWEEGKFGLDDPVSLYIPTFANQKVVETFNLKDTTFTAIPSKRAVTVRDLLTHTSGLGYPAIGTPEAQALYAKNRIPGGLATRDQKLGDVMMRLGTLPLIYQPGEKWMYGINTDVLGYLVEVWSGMPLEEFFTTRIFKPLGMNDTHFNVPSEKASRLVNFFMEDSTGIKKHDLVFGGLNMDFPLQKHDYFSGGGGLSSTTADYAAFLQMLLNGGEYNGTRILSHNSVRLMTMNQIGELSVGENKFGFGFSIITENGSRLGPSQPGTYAWGGAFSTTYFVDPKEEMVVLMYRQMWGSKIGSIDKLLKPLVYQAIND
jgi:CubicO group peptidase (beta-lactamase class C family)